MSSGAGGFVSRGSADGPVTVLAQFVAKQGREAAVRDALL